MPDARMRGLPEALYMPMVFVQHRRFDERACCAVVAVQLRGEVA